MISIFLLIHACQNARQQKWADKSFADAINQAALIQVYVSEHMPDIKPVYNQTIEQGESNESDPCYDSLCKVWIDTSTLYGKRLYYKNLFLIENFPSSVIYDTLFDLNYDDNNDYVIGYYGQCGTGIKNRSLVYLYDSVAKSYRFNPPLSSIVNPSFYMSQKKITGFYIAYGCGDGFKIEWIDNKWTLTKEFDVCNEGDSSKWNISYPLRNAWYVKTRPYQLVPPPGILETNYEPY